MSATPAFSCPEKVEELLSLLAEPNTVVLAGGTALIGQARRRKRHLVSLKGLGLDECRVDGRQVKIGAMCTISQLLSVDNDNHAGLAILQQACSRLASTFIRNAATVGGSTVACFRWSDLPAALLAADATMHIASKGKEEELSASEFFAKHPSRLFRQGAFLQSLILPRKTGRTAFSKMSPLTYGFAIWDVAVFLPEEGEGARVGLSAGISLPKRLTEVEKLLDEGERSREVLEEAVTKELSSLKVVGARTVSREYRQFVGPVVVADTIIEALENKGGQS